ncbi:TetR/AcrR family transcriptional regulator [Paenibacillus albicereus]|uniref:TetR/AcrR family transcriptional regulator n=1 Tax=Paenibacillus albicereus TaxID=2726185 RepID=A0A6H2GYC7_9BACL|nr:TetR-like C-terminal domain-containing protein [Paenibacillus albicereus]QJC52434.1 TetR/AcrR family transcriptional regulator [Paenibacillus albicereus]
MAETDSRIDPRVLRTRQMLKHALIELLGETELDKITVQLLTRRASINRVTFYLHYRDIPDLMERLAEEMADQIRQILSPFSSQNTEELERSLVDLLEHIALHSAFYKAVLSARMMPVFAEKLLQLLSELISSRMQEKAERSGEEPAIPKDIVIWYGSSALIGMIVSWLRSDMPYTPRFLAKQFMLLTKHR